MIYVQGEYPIWVFYPTYHTEFLALLGALLEIEMSYLLGVIRTGSYGPNALIILSAHVALEAFSYAAEKQNGSQQRQCQQRWKRRQRQ